MTNPRKKDKYIFGWRSVFEIYTLKNLITDMLSPLIVSFLLTVMIFSFSTSPPLYFLEKSVSLTISILPIIISLLLAGYTIVLTLFWSEYGKAIRKNKEGKNLLKDINSSFAATIMIMISSLITSLLIYFIASMELYTPHLFIEEIVNGFSIFIVLLFLLFSIWALKDIIINIYNLGVLTFHFEDVLE